MPYSSLQEVKDELKETIPLYQGIGYTDSNIKGRFSPVKYVPQAEMSKDEYPFTLLAGTILYQFGTGSRSSRASRLKKFQPEAFVEVSRADAQRLGITQDDEVKVISPVGEVTAKAKLTNTLPEGILFMPISFPTSPVGELFSITLDSRAKTPSLKACAVRLERIDSGG
jgi:predicted molibdopterin-dependent oxidoreductase YjgC